MAVGGDNVSDKGSSEALQTSVEEGHSNGRKTTDEEWLWKNVSSTARETLNYLIAENLYLIPKHYKHHFLRIARDAGQKDVLSLLRRYETRYSTSKADAAFLEKEKAIAQVAEGSKEIVREVMKLLDALVETSNEHNRSIDDSVKEIGKTRELNDLARIKDTLLGEMKKVKADNTELKNKLDANKSELMQKSIRLNLLKKHATVDHLTQIANRKHWEDRINYEISRAQKHGGNLSIAIIKIDNFKKNSDTYGRQVGDKVLVEFASLLGSQMRDTDFVARYGDEEFSIILPETGLEKANAIVESIKLNLDNKEFLDKKRDVSFAVTASYGITEYKNDDKMVDMVKRADTALNSAKGGGGNRIVAA